MNIHEVKGSPLMQQSAANIINLKPVIDSFIATQYSSCFHIIGLKALSVKGRSKC